MILIDTNILIYYFNGLPQARDFLMAHAGNMAISTITVAETLSFPCDDKQLANMKQFLSDNFIWIDYDHEIMFKSADIRRQKKTKLPDAIIAATALCHDFDLASRNVNDFKHLPLTLMNPID